MEEEDEISEQEKWTIAFLIGILFFIAASPILFRLSDQILSFIGLHTLDQKGNPTGFGWAIHVAVFIILVRLLMR